MTSVGGEGFGVIFKTDGEGSNQVVAHTFTGTPGNNPYFSQLCEAANGKLYGMTLGGGVYDRSIIFEYDPNTFTYTKKYDFEGGVNGSSSYGSLILANNGKMYGMCRSGGVYNHGVIFEYDPTTNTYIKKFDFNGTNYGRYPWGSLIQATNGKLYGMTMSGGANNYGVLFEYDPLSNIFTKKFDFNGSSSGQFPRGNLLQATNGKLYGVTTYGGVNGSMGVLFEYDLLTNVYTKKIDFEISIGGNPFGSLIQATNGKIYGMALVGGVYNFGVIYEYNPETSTYAILFNFNGFESGSAPFGSLLKSTNGKLYGMTSAGGTNDKGVLFEFDPETVTYSKKIDFNEITNGSKPMGSLIQASNEKIYGMTYEGGANGSGVLFEFDQNINNFSKKIDFYEAPNGSNPLSNLVMTNGKLYGMTSMGGAHGKGIIFEFDPLSFVYTKKFDFNGLGSGSFPYGYLLKATNGKLYGMTSEGGVNDYGVVFEFDPLTFIYTKKFDFNGLSSGSFPYGSLIQATNGKFYGITTSGGANDNGVIFEFDLLTNIYTKKFDFDESINGSYPIENLLQFSNGKMYGVTNRGGANGVGVFFEFDHITGIYTKKFDFLGSTNGESPFSSLIKATNGKLYGMTYSGGVNNEGVLFEYDPTTEVYIKKLDFDSDVNGKGPIGSLLQATNGNLYGNTFYGGEENCGVLFEYDLVSNVCTNKIDFDGVNNGMRPRGGLIEIGIQSVVEENTFENSIAVFPNPSKGLVNIDLGLVYRDVSISITDINGRAIKQTRYSNSQFLEINLTEPSGIYLVKITAENKKATIRLIKN
jgi:uncharacterized repeat protein (TIGR03803 family)